MSHGQLQGLVSRATDISGLRGGDTMDHGAEIPGSPGRATELGGFGGAINHGSKSRAQSLRDSTNRSMHNHVHGRIYYC